MLKKLILLVGLLFVLIQVSSAQIVIVSPAAVGLTQTCSSAVTAVTVVNGLITAITCP